jgi:hypothetical protein
MIATYSLENGDHIHPIFHRYSLGRSNSTCFNSLSYVRHSRCRYVSIDLEATNDNPTHNPEKAYSLPALVSISYKKVPFNFTTSSFAFGEISGFFTCGTW